MSTRSIIVITGNKSSHSLNGMSTMRLYKHSDGYVLGTLPQITEAIEASNSVMTAYGDQFGNTRAFNVPLITGKIVGACTDEYGMGAKLLDSKYEESIFEEYLTAKNAAVLLGNQSDLEYVYVVDAKNKDVSIYGGGYTGKVPVFAYKKSHIDLGKESGNNDNAALKIVALIEKLASLGWSVNKETTKVKRTSKAIKKIKTNTATL